MEGPANPSRRDRTNGTALCFEGGDAGRRWWNTYDPLTTTQLTKELTHG